MREYLNLPTARRALGALCLAVLLAGCNRDVLDPAGDIALQQRDIIYISTALMLLIIVPVMALTIVFAWRYRESNKEATYDPDFDHSTSLELVIWSESDLGRESSRSQGQTDGRAGRLARLEMAVHLSRAGHCDGQ
jgi:cytochrome o ubiquinol oxidase subunit 2